MQTIQQRNKNTEANAIVYKNIKTNAKIMQSKVLV